MPDEFIRDRSFTLASGGDKLWKVTRGSDFLIVQCDGVTVVNWNLHADYIHFQFRYMNYKFDGRYMDDYEQCPSVWEKEFDSVSVDSNGSPVQAGSLFVRKSG